MDADTIDQIIRSRPTILGVLKDRGYEVSSYENTSPDEIVKLITTNPDLLKIVATKPSSNEGEPEQRIIVVYWMDRSHLTVEKKTNELWDEYNPETDKIIVLLTETYNPKFDTQAAKQWIEKKACISYFTMKNLISNPLHHIMQPKFRKLETDEKGELVKRLHLKRPGNLPNIIYHVDMAARVLGLLPGDIVHFKRGSETCGEVDGYRICVI